MATSSPSKARYREVQALPFELAQHVQNYYEESLFTQAFGLLLSIVSSTASSPNPDDRVSIPQAPHLGLAATLAVHPKFTTRTTAREKWEQANAAMRLLRLVHKTAGPVNSKLSEAFSYRKYNYGSRGRQLGGDEERANDIDDLNTPLADVESIWTRAEDFWQVVGWAFNCSCLSGMYAARWEYWRLWLEFFLDVLETDWQIHFVRQSSEESLIWQYIELAAGGYGSPRRIIRSIFAEGNTRSLNEFREIFKHELREPVNEANKLKKREVNVDIEADEYGDYLAPDDSEQSADGDDDFVARPYKRQRTRTPSSRRVTPRTSSNSLRSDYNADNSNTTTTTNTATIHPNQTNLGGPHALRLRLRLLHLLSHVAGHPTLTSTSPTTFPDLDDLYTLFVEFTKPLALPTFAQIILPSTASNSLSADAHSTLCECLLQRMIESAAPSIRSDRYLTQRKLEAEYLPFAAGKTTVDANARVSLLLEALLRRLKGAGVLNPHRGELKLALDQGIERRLSRVRALVKDADRTGDGRRKGGGTTTTTTKGGGTESEEAWHWLVESGERMKVVLQTTVWRPNDNQR